MLTPESVHRQCSGCSPSKPVVQEPAERPQLADVFQADLLHGLWVTLVLLEPQWVLQRTFCAGPARCGCHRLPVQASVPLRSVESAKAFLPASGCRSHLNGPARSEA